MGLKWYPHPEVLHCIKGCEVRHLDTCPYPLKWLSILCLPSLIGDTLALTSICRGPIRFMKMKMYRNSTLKSVLVQLTVMFIVQCFSCLSVSPLCACRYLSLGAICLYYRLAYLQMFKKFSPRQYMLFLVFGKKEYANKNFQFANLCHIKIIIISMFS